MRPFIATVQATAGGFTYSRPFVVDHYTAPCNIGIGVVTSGAVYTVQHTFVDPFAVNIQAASAANWMPNETLVSASTNDDTNYAFAPTAIRLRLNAGTGEATFTVVQAGPE